jgi:hypothetical protein
VQGDAKDQIWQAILGLLLLVACVAVLNAINPGIITTQIGMLGVPPAGAPPTGGGPAGGGLTDANARAQLAAAGIEIKPGASLEGMKQVVIDELIRMKNACPSCDVTVTAGTDGVHIPSACSHASGNKADIRYAPTLNSYIKSSCTQIQDRTTYINGVPVVDKQWQCGGGVYAEELRTDASGNPVNHWDMKAC